MDCECVALPKGIIPPSFAWAGAIFDFTELWGPSQGKSVIIIDFCGPDCYQKQ